MCIEKDLFFMKHALDEARKAYERDEVPVGCVIVHEGVIIARGHNSVEQLQDPTAHAEMSYGNHRFPMLCRENSC